MALSYEKTQGPLHSPLAQVLSEIHTNVNASSVMLSSKVTKTTRFFFSNLATTVQKNHEYFFPNLAAPFFGIAAVNISSNVSDGKKWLSCTHCLNWKFYGADEPDHSLISPSTC